MQLKLAFQPFDRMTHRAVLMRWHVTEGEPVQFGEDLVDLHITELRRPDHPSLARQIIEAEAAAGGDVSARIRSVDMRLRITASETAYLNTILVREGEVCRVGDVLAILTLDPEPIGTLAGTSLPTVPDLRVIANPVQEDF